MTKHAPNFPSTHSETAAPSAGYGFFSIEKRLGKIFKYLNFKNKVILDAGCAQGAYTMEMAKTAKYVAGIDIQEMSLKSFHRKKAESGCSNIGISNMRIERQGFKTGIFDIVTLIEVIEHVADETATLMECKRILKNKGHIVITAPNKIFPFETHEVRMGRKRFKRLTPLVSWLPRKTHLKFSTARNYLLRDLKKMLIQCGFEIEAADYIYPPLDRLPVPVFLKKIYRKTAAVIERTPLRILGVSIILIGKKK
jgi:2-polyprenyl-3-methyl-5-hydroxy-6-metoxy-1,4-benzoquinol methylase